MKAPLSTTITPDNAFIRLRPGEDYMEGCWRSLSRRFGGIIYTASLDSWNASTRVWQFTITERKTVNGEYPVITSGWLYEPVAWHGVEGEE